MFKALAHAALLTLIVGCGGGSGDATTPTPATAVPAGVSVFSGNDQTAPQLRSLTAPVTVGVVDQEGQPLAGVGVEFSALDGGVASPTTSTTDAAGRASAVWTLGLSIGRQTLNARVVGLPAAAFVATATRAPPTRPFAISKVAGDAQTVLQYRAMPQPLSVRVIDALGNSVPELAVAFSSSLGSGNAVVRTDSNGSASWRGYFETAGEQMVEARIDGNQFVTFTVLVGPTGGPFDGEYDVSFNFLPYQEFFNSLKMFIVDGTVTGIVDLGGQADGLGHQLIAADFNESDGHISLLLSSAHDQPLQLSAILTIDAARQVRAIGRVHSATRDGFSYFLRPN